MKYLILVFLLNGCVPFCLGENFLTNENWCVYYEEDKPVSKNQINAITSNVIKHVSEYYGKSIEEIEDLSQNFSVIIAFTDKIIYEKDDGSISDTALGFTTSYPSKNEYLVYVVWTQCLGQGALAHELYHVFVNNNFYETKQKEEDYISHPDDFFHFNDNGEINNQSLECKSIEELSYVLCGTTVNCY